MAYIARILVPYFQTNVCNQTDSSHQNAEKVNIFSHYIVLYRYRMLLIEYFESFVQIKQLKASGSTRPSHIELGVFFVLLVHCHTAVVVNMFVDLRCLSSPCERGARGNGRLHSRFLLRYEERLQHDPVTCDVPDDCVKHALHRFHVFCGRCLIEAAVHFSGQILSRRFAYSSVQ